MTVSVFSVNWEQLRVDLLEKYQTSTDLSELLIELHYWPGLDFFSGLLAHDQTWIEAHEHYQKQSYRNRCYVLTANKTDCLTVPVQSLAPHQPIRDVQIDTSQHWQDRHWRCLQAAYGKAPFFDYYGPDVHAVLQKNWTYLFDLNWEILTICRKWLRTKLPVNLTESYEKLPAAGIFDARSRLNARKRTENYTFYQPSPYAQNFGPDFVPNLSLLDIMFCQGPEARHYLKSERPKERKSDF